MEGRNLRLPPSFFEYEGDSAFVENPQPVWHFLLEKISAPKSGGIFRIYKECKYPAKGFPFFEAMYAMDIVKKYSMAFVMTLSSKELLLPYIAFALVRRKKQIAVLERFLERYVILADYTLYGVYLKPKYWGICPAAIRDLASQFLQNIGISQAIADRFGKVVGTIIEYDDAYRYRIEDAMSEFTAEEFISDPRKAMQKFSDIFTKRDKQVFFKFTSIARIARLAFLVPWIRKAFVKALQSIDFSHLQLDDMDRYHCHLRTGYDFFGMTDQERVDRWYEIHDDDIPPRVELIA